jgi:hypothetical protein
MDRTSSIPLGDPPKNIFISYSHKDKAWLDRVLVFLRPSQRAGRVGAWSDRQTDRQTDTARRRVAE